MHDVGIPGVHRDLAHGTNDAQKTMGIITLTLITAGALPADAGPPFWVILSSGLAIALGTYTGGWRIIQTLGKRVSDIQTPQGFAAETSRATASAVRTREDLRVVIGRVATRFELGQPVREPAPISGGLSNELWRLDTDHGTFAIKRMVVNANLPTFVENIETAFRIEQRAWAAGVPMPEPIAEPSSGHALARVDNALFRVHRWVDGTTGAGSPVEAAELLARIHAAGQPRWTRMPDQGWAVDRWGPDLARLAHRVESGPDRVLVVESHGDLDRKNTLRRADGVLIALDWDAAAPVAAVHEAVGVALDWSDAEPSLFAESIEAYVRSGVVVPAQPWVFAGWVAAQGGWLDFNATHRTDSTLHSTEVQTTLARLHQVATRMDALLAALRYR